MVLDNPTVFNRLGAQNPNWITYALQRDVIAVDPVTRLPTGDIPGTNLTAGNVELRPDKRTRPLVVRSVAGACLTVNFTNLLAPVANPNNAQQDALFNDDQVAGRCAGFHASGTELVDDISSDGSMVGANPGANTGDSTNNPSNAVCGPGMAGTGGSRTYNLYTPHEGAFVINSYGATLGSEQSSGNLGIGMFGQLNVQPAGARFYRSIVTEEELRLATVGTVPSDCGPGQVSGVDCNPGGQPIIDYEATYPATNADGSPSVWAAEGKAGLPVLNMLTAANELVHSDINAIIAGPNADGSFPNDTYPLESTDIANNPQLPNRLEAFREFTSVFHDEQTNSQVFPRWYEDPVLGYTLTGVRDQFMINYGSGGIGSEIIANRLHTGPMHDCTDCAYEEFFLASQTVGDPGGLVNMPANSLIEQCDPTNILDASCWRQFVDNIPGEGEIAVGANPPIPGNFALFQEDPSNIHPSYTGDFTKIRNTHAGAFEQHIFHLHNHQWLFNPNDDNGNYLDAQEIMPGSGHTYELVNGGVGNRNKTAGDAIFHCHFYPHFAQGMWYHIRIHDTFERGTVLAVSGADDPQNPTTGFHTDPFALRSGQPAAGARALPDAELPDGWPIPAVVPIPGKPMPQMPATVTVMAVDRGDFGVLSGRRPPNGLGQGPDSAQAVVDRISVAGADGLLHTADDVSPGYPFWLAGNECGVPTLTDACPQGTVGQRNASPPLDMLTEVGAAANGYAPAQAGGWDGGLPRHNLRGYTSGGVSLDTQNRLDFRKVIEISQPVYYPEIGTDLEKVSMAYHSVRERPSAVNNLVDTNTTGGNFVLNGAPPVPGGPFQDPCIDDAGTPLLAGVVGEWFDGDNNPATLGTAGASAFSSENPRTYKIANVQIDAVFNKVGHHYPQERIIALWEDVAPTIAKQRPPEPLVMRFNTFDCGKLLHSNLVPGEFELDDFQVRTPTDIIGQHIHLPKWDLTTNDGSSNGWNYEDGALAPSIVDERIHAINNFNALAGSSLGLVAAAVQLGFDDKVHPGVVQVLLANNTTLDLTDLSPVLTIDSGDPGGTPAGLGCDPLTQPLCPEEAQELHAQPHPFFGAGVGDEYLGARTVIQRILVDPVVNVAGVDRGLGLTFSHDHYGPSTFQQIGLYSTILAEPAGSTWVHNESGTPLGTRDDGGPTTWQAAILPPAAAPLGSTVESEAIPDHREFYFEMSDFQHAYNAGTYVGAGPDGRPMLTEIVQPDPFNAGVAFAPDIQDTWQQTVNPPLKLKENGSILDVVAANGACPGPAGNFDPAVPRPCAESINIAHESIWVVNYRNEPVGLRVFDPNAVGPDGQNGTQAAGQAGDLAFAFQSREDRAIPELNTALGNTPYPGAPGYCQGDPTVAGDLINCDRRPGDPFTPIMRAFERDQVKIKIQVGATEEQHQATVHGLKWLSNGSGFGRSGNSGWRNFQSHGISEQFSLQLPLNPDNGQAGNTVDYLYATDATRDGMWLGTWGVLRSYGQQRQDLFELPDNPQRGPVRVVNANDFTGVCPRGQGNEIDNLIEYDVTAVLANDVLPNNLGVTINGNPQIMIGGVVVGGDSDGNGIADNVGGPLNPAGGTLVYNRRGTVVPPVEVGEAPEPVVTLPGGAGPLNDPTAIMYVRTDELVFDTACQALPGSCATALGDPIGLQPGVPVEPLVLRANAGDCIEVTLRNALPFTPVIDEDPLSPTFGQVIDKIIDPVPDLAGWQDMMWGVTRRIQGAGVNAEMLFFNNNLVRPSSYVGLHAQLVEFDSSRDDGLLVGGNAAGQALVSPGGNKLYRWYAGDLRHEPVQGGNPNQRRFQIVATPVEFGGTNLLSADRVKQPQKGLFGSLVIEPAGATVAEDTQVPDGQGTGAATRLTRAQVTVTSPAGDAGSGGTYREALAIGHKTANLRWKDGTAIANIHQGELGREGAEDSGHAGFNYAMEPSWFRFKLPPDADFGNAGTPNSFGSIPNQQAFYANKLVELEDNTIPAIPGVSELGDPVTPVFRATADTLGENPVHDTRMYVLNGASADRDGTFILHGHVWQRDPHVCTGTSQDPTVLLEGRCDPNEPVPSQALGLNLQAKYMGGEEGMGHVYAHWPILFDAGGTGGVTGDYLYRDYSPSGNRNGQFGILRVE
ncbi:MAG: hypothetical protein OES38_08045 [Gammaproteobacteria bacterium]|nr:hypothetical protein [Gammaproteobacteria bacterium]